MSNEAVRLTKEERVKWDQIREKAIEQLKSEFEEYAEEWKQAVITKGVSRLIDEKFSLASKKLEAIDNGYEYIVAKAKEAKISDKEQLIKEILEKDSKNIFNKDMLRKLNIEELNSLKARL